MTRQIDEVNRSTRTPGLTDLSEQATADISADTSGFIVRRICNLPQDEELSLAHDGAALWGLASVAGRTW
jgi:hypothetical protein